MTCGGTTRLSVSSSAPVDREPWPWADCLINTAGESPGGSGNTGGHTSVTNACRFSRCGLFKWERDGMLKVPALVLLCRSADGDAELMALFVFWAQEKTGPKIGGELLLPRGEEHGKFLHSK